MNSWKVACVTAVTAAVTFGLCRNAAANDATQTDGYMNNAALIEAVNEIAASNESCELSTIGKSRHGADIFLLTLSGNNSNADENPALLITAGLDGTHLVGTETAVRVAQNLLAAHAELLKEITVYIIPRVNPDGTEVNFAEIKTGFLGTTTPVDNDRDGETDEDGPNDLNGDGYITQMRRLNPPLDDLPTHLADPVEPRILKKPDTKKGERAIYTLYTEGLDSDSDGLIAEDGPGYVDLDRNFMQGYPEHAIDAGSFQLSEQESHALATFVLKRKNIVAAITYGRHDNLINVPDGKGKDISGRGPKNIDGGDVNLYKEMSKIYKETTEQKRAAKQNIDGSFHHWLYAQRGLPSFATSIWGRPEVKKEDEKDKAKPAPEPEVPEVKEEKLAGVDGTWSGSLDIPEMGALDFELELKTEADQSITGSLITSMFSAEVKGTLSAGGQLSLTSAGGGENSIQMTLAFTEDTLAGSVTGPGGEAIDISATRTSTPDSDAQETKPESSNDKDKVSDAAADEWLRYSDKERNGEGFVEWQPFDHPTLGKVEIGGFIPGFKTNPPADQLDELAVKQSAFAVEVINKRAKLIVEGPVVIRLGSGLYDIRFSIVNDGYFPSSTAQARKARTIPPTVVRLSTPVDHIVTGDRVTRSWGINGNGGRFDQHWIIRADDGSELSIEIVNAQLGNQTISFKAEATSN